MPIKVNIVDSSSTVRVKPKCHEDEVEVKTGCDVKAKFLDQKINEEIANREAADEVLDEKIQKEKADRKAADQALKSELKQEIQTEVANEATARETADRELKNELETQIDDVAYQVEIEAQTRAQKDSQLQNKIQAEKAAREAAIAAEIRARQNAIAAESQERQTTIATEKSEREAVDASLQEQINEIIETGAVIEFISVTGFPEGTLSPANLQLLTANKVNRLEYQNIIYYLSLRDGNIRKYFSNSLTIDYPEIDVDTVSGNYIILPTMNKRLEEHINNNEVHITNAERMH